MELLLWCNRIGGVLGAPGLRFDPWHSELRICSLGCNCSSNLIPAQGNPHASGQPKKFYLENSRLRVWCYHCSSLGVCCGKGSIPGPGIFICCECGQKKTYLERFWISSETFSDSEVGLLDMDPFFFMGVGKTTMYADCSRENNNIESPGATPQVHPWATYSVGVKQLYGAEHIKFSGHEELDSHIPGEGGNVVLNCPLVNLFKKLLGGLFDKESKE